MANILNVDLWDWVHPETQKVYRLRKGDEVPAEVLDFTDDKESFFAGPRPVLLRQDDSRETSSSPTEPTAVRESNRAAAAAEKK
jgi:hypothetical protein